MVLAMAQYGARGNTKNQMKSALHLSENEGVSRAGYQNLIGSLMVGSLNALIHFLSNTIRFLYPCFQFTECSECYIENSQ